MYTPFHNNTIIDFLDVMRLPDFYYTIFRTLESASSSEKNPAQLGPIDIASPSLPA
jgi:hypothetical protein